MLTETHSVTETVTADTVGGELEARCESIQHSVHASSPPDARMLRHRECGSHPAADEEISKILRHGGARPNSGGFRAGAGRKPAVKSALTGSRKPASKALAETRIARSIESLALPVGDGDRWYCARTGYRAELIAVEELTKQGYPTFFARHERELPDRRIVIVPMFPGYLFVRFNQHEERWRPITSTPGIRSLYGSSPETPAPAERGIIERFIARVDADGILRKQWLPPADPFEKGDVLRVTDGPFTGFAGLCEMSAGRRIKVMLQVFAGRGVPVELDASQLEKVA